MHSAQAQLHQPQSQRQSVTLMASLDQANGKVHSQSGPPEPEIASQRPTGNVISCDSINIETHTIANSKATLSQSYPKKTNNGQLNAITETNFRIIGGLLGFSLCTSILNTFLLSFIIKSIQLSGKGLLEGNLHNNLTSIVLGGLLDSLSFEAAVVAELPIRITDDKILFSDQIVSGSELHLSPADGGNLLMRTRRKPLGSYIAIKDHRLEMSSEKLSIESILPAPHNSRPPEEEVSDLDQRNLVLSSTQFRVSKRRIKSKQVSQDHLVGLNEPTLMKFDAKQNLVTLDELSHLNNHNFNKPISALQLNNELDVGDAAIIGSLDHNLELQARDGDLNCKGGDMLRLVSKSASLGLVSRLKMHARAPKLMLSSEKGLYLKHLVDNAVVTSNSEHRIGPNQQKQTNNMELLPPTADNSESSTHQKFTDMATNGAAVLSVPSNSRPGIVEHQYKQEQELRHDEDNESNSGDGKGKLATEAAKRHRNSLQAYELIIVNGALMASA